MTDTPDPKRGQYLKDELYGLVRQDDRIFEFLQAGALDGVWYWDVENPAEEWLSPRFKDLFGYADHEIESSAAWWQENIHPDDLDLALKNFERHLADPSHPYDQVVRYRHKDGSTVWVRCRGLAIRDDDGRPLRMLGCHQDITELMENEQQLRVHRRRLEQANRSLREFTHIVSHDLKEPLRGISHLSNFLLQDSAEQLDEKGIERLNDIQHRVDRVRDMIGELLRMSDIDRMEPVFSQVDLDTLLHNEVLPLFLEGAAQVGVEVRVPRKLPEQSCNAALVGQVFQNLIGNAIRYRGASDCWIEIGYEAGSPHRYYVADNGQGVEERHQERIFQMFQRLHRKGDGMGVGLALVRKIVEQHGGRIELESEQGKGSRFWFTLEPDDPVLADAEPQSC